MDGPTGFSLKNGSDPTTADRKIISYRWWVFSVLPLHLKQTFPPIIWIFNEGEGDEIEFRLPFKIFSTKVYRRIAFHEFLISLFLFLRSINCSWVFLVETTFWTNGRTTNWWHIINTWRKYRISWELTKGTIHLLRKHSFRLFTPQNPPTPHHLTHPTYDSGRWTEIKEI